MLILLAGASLSGAEFYEVMKGGKQPNHLVPVLPLDDYDHRISKLLFLADGRCGRMVVRPSFEPEYCLSVHAEITEDSVKTHEEWEMVPDEEKVYVMTVTSASESIWDSLSQSREETNDTDIEISRVDRRISRDLAVAIQRVWAKGLQLTRYPSAPQNGLDGTMYQFSVWVRGLGELRGETWSPQRGLTHDLVGVGLDLIAYVRQDSGDQQFTEEELIKKLQKLESKIPKAK